MDTRKSPVILTVERAGERLRFVALQNESPILDPIFLSAHPEDPDFTAEILVEGFQQLIDRLDGESPAALRLAVPPRMAADAPADAAQGDTIASLPLFRNAEALRTLLEERMAVPVIVETGRRTASHALTASRIWKFEPILKSVLWGGERIIPYKEVQADRKQVGESWELSEVEGKESIVSDGPDAGMLLPELIARYGAALLGERNYTRFGGEFPLLVKFIDARADLSIQVHPNDDLAWRRHRTRGKSELWYVIDAAEGASLRSGFARPVTPDRYAESVANHTLTDLLAEYPVQRGDVFFLPAGRVHSIGAGCFLAEIQQSSDITYRIYDFDRRDAQGNLRELHTELAREAIDYSVQDDYRTHYTRQPNRPVELMADPFTVALAELTRPYRFDLSAIDSFFIVICTEGHCLLTADSGEQRTIHQGETLLLPAITTALTVAPDPQCTLLTTYV